MCGRFSLVVKKEKIKKQLGLESMPEGEIEPRFNIAPTQQAAVVLDSAPRQLQFLEWGLVPAWSADGTNVGKLINARSEGVESRPSFRLPIRERRCLVVADSFYEWKTDPSTGQRRPLRIFLKNDELLIMAGIWDVWQQNGLEKRTFSILTCAPNRDLQTVHDRMPVILPAENEQRRWLDRLKIEEVLSLLRPLPSGFLDMYRVSEKLNSVGAEGPFLHEAVLENPTLF